jgi:uncharacterized Zn finger protein (UPF0148 family)
MTVFEIFCESCNTDSYVESKQPPKFCPVCGTEVDDTNIAEEEWQEDVDSEWDRISEESLRDLDDWK